MGALTLKSFPFELRGWDIEKFESIDPTDSFGSSTRVYVSKDQVVQIEPDYNINTFNTWLTDKGRQFFDGIFNKWSLNANIGEEKETWLNIFNTVTQITYIYDHCNIQFNRNKFFTVVFENLGLEAINILTILSQNYSFVKIRRAENFKVNNDLESTFQLNAAADKIKLGLSTLCLLICSNPRYEGYYLNLNLRQRYLKGNFKCLSLGSLIDLTFPLSFLGSNLKTIKTITEGNNFICQDFKFSDNPIIIFNNELLKRNDRKNYVEIFKTLAYSNKLNNTWNGLNMLNSSLSETGIHATTAVLPLTLKDLNEFSCIYFLNTTTRNTSNLKKIAELKLLNYSLLKKEKIYPQKLILDQNTEFNINKAFFNKISTLDHKYFHLPSSNFYENEEIFINTEGFIKRTTKLIFRKKSKNNWKILRKFLKNFKNPSINLNTKNKEIIIFNNKKISNFKSFIFFQYYSVQTLTNLNFLITTKNKKVMFNNSFNNFKPKTNKLLNTKIKYWLDDFFSGGKDEYSHNSLILNNCSKMLRSESCNFF